MRKKILSALFSAVGLLCIANRTVVFYDHTAGECVGGVTVIANNGIILGCTDSQGRINLNQSDFPINISSIGYQPMIARIPCDTIELIPATYSLPEIEIGCEARPITRIVTYAREYTTGVTSSDTLQVFGQYMLESFIADGKVKGYSKSDARAKIFAGQVIGRNFNRDGEDKIFSPEESGEISMLSFINMVSDLPRKGISETTAIRNGFTFDSIPGKYSTAYRLSKLNNVYRSQFDILSDYEKHRFSPTIFKLIGMTMNMEEATFTAGYLANEKGEYSLQDLLYSTVNIKVNAQGKLFKHLLRVKESCELDINIEQYPVLTEYLTIEEYKALKKDKDRTIPISAPEIATPLPPAIINLQQKALNTCTNP